VTQTDYKALALHTETNSAGVMSGEYEFTRHWPPVTTLGLVCYSLALPLGLVAMAAAAAAATLCEAGQHVSLSVTPCCAVRLFAAIQFEINIAFISHYSQVLSVLLGCLECLDKCSDTAPAPRNIAANILLSDSLYPSSRYTLSAITAKARLRKSLPSCVE